jgi:phosphatidylinositol glycan class T
VSQGLIHYHLSHPFLQLCTENLTPFLSLLPSKGVSGLSSLLAQPGIVFAWGFKTEGSDVIMPSATSVQGQWRGWWEGVVDLVPEEAGSRAFSLRSLFKKGIPRPFPEAERSVLRFIKPEEAALRMDPPATLEEAQWVDGRWRDVAEWDLLDEQITGQDVRFRWDGDGEFRYRASRGFLTS